MHKIRELKMWFLGMRKLLNLILFSYSAVHVRRTYDLLVDSHMLFEGGGRDDL